MGEGREESGTSPHRPRLSLSGATRPLFQITPIPGRIICSGLLILAVLHWHLINFRTTGERQVCSKLKGAGNGPLWQVGGYHGLRYQDTGWSGLSQVLISLQRPTGPWPCQCDHSVLLGAQSLPGYRTAPGPALSLDPSPQIPESC